MSVPFQPLQIRVGVRVWACVCSQVHHSSSGRARQSITTRGIGERVRSGVRVRAVGEDALAMSRVARARCDT